MLQTITDSRDEKSFNNRLCELSLILMDVITTAKPSPAPNDGKLFGIASAKHLSVRSSAPGRSSTFHTPKSDTYSLSHDLSSIVSPLVLEPEHQNFGGFDFPDWDDSFGLITPTDSGPCEPEQHQANELVSITNSFGRDLLENLNFLASTLQPAGDGMSEREAWWKWAGLDMRCQRR